MPSPPVSHRLLLWLCHPTDSDPCVRPWATPWAAAHPTGPWLSGGSMGGNKQRSLCANEQRAPGGGSQTRVTSAFPWHVLWRDPGLPLGRAIARMRVWSSGRVPCSRSTALCHCPRGPTVARAGHGQWARARRINEWSPLTGLADSFQM